MASLKALKALSQPKQKTKAVQIIGSEAERKRREEQLQEEKIADLTFKKSEAEACLSQGLFGEAIPGAQEALQLSIDLYGKESIDVVPCYLLLAEANLGLQQLGQAEWYLSQANWAVVKTPDCSFHIRSIVHRCFGKLYAQQGRTDEALTHLASNVYYCARESGAKSIDCADGYFLLAQVFYMSAADEGFWLKHEPSGKYCCVEKGANSGEPTLCLKEGGYGEADTKFALDGDGCLVHVASGQYAQPASGAASPANGAVLVLRDNRAPDPRDGEQAGPPHAFTFNGGCLKHAANGKFVYPSSVIGSEQVNLTIREGQDDKLRVTRWAPDGRQSALAFFSKVLDIWYTVLAGPDGVEAALAGTATLSDVVIDEARRMVQRVLEVVTAEAGGGSVEAGRCHLTLGMVQQFLGGAREAIECYEAAVGVLGGEAAGPAGGMLLDEANERLAALQV